MKNETYLVFTACSKSLKNFKRNYLENYNDSDDAVKTKNAQFFMIFLNISFFHMIVSKWPSPLKGGIFTA